MQSLFFFHVNCRRITGSGNSKCPLPADISARVRRFPVFTFFCCRGNCSPGTSTKFNHRLLSLCLQYEMVHIQGYCRVKIITVLSHKAPRRLQRHESTQSDGSRTLGMLNLNLNALMASWEGHKGIVQRTCKLLSKSFEERVQWS